MIFIFIFYKIIYLIHISSKKGNERKLDNLEHRFGTFAKCAFLIIIIITIVIAERKKVVLLLHN